jgi:hypothetical protein
LHNKIFGEQAVNDVPLDRDYHSAIENVIVGLKKLNNTFPEGLNSFLK